MLTYSRTSPRLAAVLLLSLASTATCLPPDSRELPHVEQRAAPVAPNGYIPAQVSCPDSPPAVRTATALSPEETEWLPLRGNNTLPALKTFLSRANISGIDAGSYLDEVINNGSAVPRIGIAISGGGYRALMNGAGALAAFDNRTANSTSDGQLGGLLQATTYLSGLSGGAWLVGSLYVQNFTSVESIISSNGGFLSSIWQFEDSIITGPADIRAREYYRQLLDSVKGKADAGFNTSITDYWGRALSYQLVNPVDGGPAYTFSSIADDSDFSQAQAPMPIIIALERQIGTLQVPANATIFEFNPWEMGSYDPALAAFAPLKYIGSNFTNGSVPSDGECIAGVDNAGFVMGTSSSLFNQAFLQIQDQPDMQDELMQDLNETLLLLGEANKDVANWPNPFYQFNAGDNSNIDSTIVTLVDGGEALQNIPLHPLTLIDRQVDVIFAVDGSADTQSSWPNGTSMVASYAASSSSTNNSAFPEVPDQNSFVNLGLNQRPTFFGCEGNETSGPLIVYIPNAPYTFQSNVSTFDLSYSNEERDRIIQNGYNVATMGNGTVDAGWLSCVGCAVLARSMARTGNQPPSVCVDCFSRYCWNGTTNSTLPNTYEPIMILSSGANPVPWASSVSLVICFVVLLLAY
ncbi:lysophospholipase [Plectosphaerella plurivora]|uniref:Lysophospholipase n=1 Tax=Plectosphaerella plurivora TaxID=936078 RepID=A0A9P8V8B6_9PEZI|nr:lysophospholipase [Plectosphaerella plurivora]